MTKKVPTYKEICDFINEEMNMQREKKRFTTGLSDIIGDEVYWNDVVKRDDGEYKIIWDQQNLRFIGMNNNVHNVDDTGDLFKVGKELFNIIQSGKIVSHIYGE